MQKNNLIIPPGNVLTIRLDAFAVRLTFEEQSVLSLQIVEGENAGFSDKIPYEVISLRGGHMALSWVETNGSAIVHVMDPQGETTCCFILPKTGRFQRLDGKLDLSAFQMP